MVQNYLKDFFGVTNHEARVSMTWRSTVLCFLWLSLRVWAETQAVVDPPIQLIYPDSEHQNLLVNEKSLKTLEAIKLPVSVVSSMYQSLDRIDDFEVVGPLHSGKSFLANQLMGKTSGFALGPTVEPKTRVRFCT